MHLIWVGSTRRSRVAGIASLTHKVGITTLILTFIQAAFSHMGITIAGGGTLSTTGFLEAARLEGHGTMYVPFCGACPALTGSLVLEKTPTKATLMMSLGL